MANKEQLKILKRGVDSWNEWRAQNPRVRIDLRGAELSDFGVSGANFLHGDLRTAQFEGAKLNESNLSNASLNLANMVHADLTEANLTGANLSRANLTGANLTGVDLMCANLTGTNLTNATLTRVQLYETTIAFTSLKTTKGLDGCQHLGPTAIDCHTLIASGPLPEVFLRGCGLPNDFVSYIQSFWNQRQASLDFYSCFISYSHVDKAFAKKLHNDLGEVGVRCWLDEEDLRVGEPLSKQIDTAIKRFDKVLLVLSESALKNSWIADEIKRALEKEKNTGKTVLFPIQVDDELFAGAVTPIIQKLRERFVLDFSNWRDSASYERAFRRLARDLATHASAELGGRR